jgi:hypothetical protein
VSSGADNILTFTATAPEAQRAVGIANATAAAYIVWRADVLGKPVARAIDEVKAKLAQSGTSGAATADLQKQLNTLEVLRTSNNDRHARRPGRLGGEDAPDARQGRPLGAAIGLVVALLLVAAREAIDTTVRSESDVEDILGAPVLASVRTLPRRTKLVTFGRHDTVFGDTYALLAATLAQGAETPTCCRDERGLFRGEDDDRRESGDCACAPRPARDPRRLRFPQGIRRGSLRDPARVAGNAAGARRQSPGPCRRVGSDARRSHAGGGPDRRSQRCGPQTAKTPGVGRLWVLPAGGTDRAGVSANRLMRLLDELREHADFVVLDTPPALLTAEMADIADQIDSALIVVAADA